MQYIYMLKCSRVCVLVLFEDLRAVNPTQAVLSPAVWKQTSRSDVPPPFLHQLSSMGISVDTK